MNFKKNDKIKFLIDTEIYRGVIKRIDEKNADVLTDIGLVLNIPINILENYYD